MPPSAAAAGSSPQVPSARTDAVPYSPAALPLRWDLIFCIVVLWGVLSWFLGGEWSLSEQYAYGWFVPFLAAALFWLRWEQAPAANPPAPSRTRDGLLLTLALVTLASLLPLRLVQIANPEWRILGWVHAALAALLTLILIWRSGGRPWLVHLSFPVLFFFVAVPWLRGFEDYVIQELMRHVAALSVEVVALFGIPAQAEGNLIRIGSGVVGVNEACSGVRSLQTSFMIGLLLGELNRLPPFRRCVMLAGSIATALFANAFRATYLVWVAAGRGMEEVERQHDLIGYFILGAVFVGSLMIAAWLKRGVIAKPTVSLAIPPPGVVGVPWSMPRWGWYAIAFWLVGTEGAVEGWFRWHERGLPSAPAWDVQWPEKAAKFRDIPIPERSARILRFDEGRSVEWRSGAAPQDPGYLMFHFRWKPGRNSAHLASDHRPDVCLPASGLKQVADHGRKAWPIAGVRRPLEFQQLEFARNPDPRSQRVHVFYCLSEDAPREDLDFNVYVTAGGWDHAWKRIRLALAGRRNLGQQMIEILMFEVGGSEDAAKRFPAVLEQVVRVRPAN